MEHGQELLALILPPQGRLAVAAAETAGLLPGPGLVLVLEHKAATGSQTVAGLLDRDLARQLRDGLDLWLQAVAMSAPEPPGAPAAPPAHLVMEHDDGTVEFVESSTVARWLASGAEGMDL